MCPKQWCPSWARLHAARRAEAWRLPHRRESLRIHLHRPRGRKQTSPFSFSAHHQSSPGRISPLIDRRAEKGCPWKRRSQPATQVQHRVTRESLPLSSPPGLGFKQTRAKGPADLGYSKHSKISDSEKLLAGLEYHRKPFPQRKLPWTFSVGHSLLL